MTLNRRILPVLAIAALPIAGAYSGPYTDDLSRCLVEQTTEEDRIALVTWMFTAAALHPAVTSIASVSDEQVEQANAQMGSMVIRLLTEACRDEARKAMKYEGEATFQTSFEVLGRVAGQELFQSPEVASALGDLQKHIDEDKLKAALKGDE